MRVPVLRQDRARDILDILIVDMLGQLDAQEDCFSRVARTCVLVKKFSRMSGGEPTTGEDSIHLPMAFSRKGPTPGNSVSDRAA
jgi:hypothetical protein